MKLNLKPVQKGEKVIVDRIDKKLRRIYLKMVNHQQAHAEAYSKIIKYVVKNSNTMTPNQINREIVNVYLNINDHPKIKETALNMSKAKAKEALFKAYFWVKINERYKIWLRVGVTLRKGFKLVQTDIKSVIKQSQSLD